ncbi:MAG: electron transfer flavoprotein subunit beta/FixA family protein [bacterium]|nr:electron transfer flavoprotein subunit beta/FixA family protein [bacterium]
MKIAVLVKCVPDSEAKIALTSDGKDWVRKDVKLDLNPYDEYAIEEALKIKEAQAGSTVTVVSFGQAEVTDALRKALAMGADDAIHAVGDNSPDPRVVAVGLTQAISGKGFDLILAGKAAIDDDYMAIGTMVAAGLDLPNVSVVTKLTLSDGKATCEREIDGGIEIVETTLPAVITCQKGLNEPRYPSLKGIMAAKKKTIEQVNVTVPAANVIVEQYIYPVPRQGARFIGKSADDIPELIRLLKEEAKVL